MACGGELIAAGMTMGMAAALGYEIYDVKVSGVCPILTFSWRQRVDALPRVPRTKPPGNCTDSQHEWLETLKYWACKRAEGSCKSYHSPAELAAKIIAKEACMNARLNVLIECYGALMSATK